MLGSLWANVRPNSTEFCRFVARSPPEIGRNSARIGQICRSTSTKDWPRFRQNRPTSRKFGRHQPRIGQVRQKKAEIHIHVELLEDLGNFAENWSTSRQNWAKSLKFDRNRPRTGQNCQSQPMSCQMLTRFMLWFCSPLHCAMRPTPAKRLACNALAFRGPEAPPTRN